jgi:threonine dehydratase
MEFMELIGLEDLRAAADRIAGRVLRTPLLPWDEALWLKAENLQPVGAFKQRGAFNAVARLSAAERAAGVLTHSSGNHGAAVARAARAFGVPATVVVPDSAVASKVRAIKELGAEILVVPAAAQNRGSPKSRVKF